MCIKNKAFFFSCWYKQDHLISLLCFIPSYTNSFVPARWRMLWQVGLAHYERLHLLVMCCCFLTDWIVECWNPGPFLCFLFIYFYNWLQLTRLLSSFLSQPKWKKGKSVLFLSVLKKRCAQKGKQIPAWMGEEKKEGKLPIGALVNHVLDRALTITLAKVKESAEFQEWIS